LVHADAPEDQTNSRQHGGGIGQPQAHLGRLLVVVGLGELDDHPVAQAAGTEDFGDEGADD
jgi:hypothetical protein